MIKHWAFINQFAAQLPEFNCSYGIILVICYLGPLTAQQLLATASDEWTGYGGIGDYAKSNGDTLEVMSEGHQIRDGVFESLPSDTVDTGGVFDCVVVGGGVSGLSAAVFFQTYGSPRLTSLVLENHPMFGGEAKRNEFMVDGQRIMGPQGADHFQVPLPHSFMARFFELIGLDWREFQYQKWNSSAPEIPVGNSFEMLGVRSGFSLDRSLGINQACG